jgi:hypothetical protein
MKATERGIRTTLNGMRVLIDVGKINSLQIRSVKNIATSPQTQSRIA